MSSTFLGYLVIAMVLLVLWRLVLLVLAAAAIAFLVQAADVVSDAFEPHPPAVVAPTPNGDPLLVAVPPPR